MVRPSWWGGVALAAVTVVHLTCSGEGPAAPRHVPAPAADSAAVVPLAAAQNLPPIPVLRTTPPIHASTGAPTVFGPAPLTVKFNLCRSEDPDEADRLNYQFHFGDSGRPAFDDDGAFDPDFDHFCRTEHVYERPGEYTATVSVTDKHLDDQSDQVVALARRTLSVTIVAAVPQAPTPKPEETPAPSPDPTPTPVPPRVFVTIVSNNGNMSYSPNPASARVGQRIVWVNGHSMVHTATADGGDFDTGFLAPGESSGVVTVGNAGTYPYHCTVHPGMVGTLNITP
jgi:plastocyanin